MEKLKIITIVGARPQFIKLSPFSKEIRKHFNEIIIHTGQHYDKEMSILLFEDLNIPKPDYNLNIGSGTHAQQTGNMLISIENILLKEKPNLVVTFGDTNSTLAGTLAAAKLHIKTLHIESGLRSFNKNMPEEINRIASDHMSDFLFAPTNNSVENLKNEGLSNKTYLLGDIMVDSLKNNLQIAIDKSEIDEKDFYLVTLHRPYNVDDPENLNKIIQNLSKLNKKIIFPLHPRTKNIIIKNSINIPNNIKILKPQGYLDFIKLQYLSDKIITDSGGVQKEAYLLSKPCITLRSETEWIETIDAGWNLLLDPKEPNFVNIINNFNPSNKKKKIFGDNVSYKMVEEIKNILNFTVLNPRSFCNP